MLPSKSVGKEDKDSGKKSSTSTSRNLWVSGLASSIRATDLKQAFSKYGKVIGAKVVTSARTPGARCYGYVTMASNEDATKCIRNLHRRELRGRKVSVERAKPDIGVPTKKEAMENEANYDPNAENNENTLMNENKSADASPIKCTSTTAKGSNDADKSTEGGIDKKVKSEGKSNKDNKESSSRKSRSKVSSKSRDRDRSLRRRRFESNSSKERKINILSMEEIRAEREKQQLRDRLRAFQHEERKRRMEQQRDREFERWKREESERLARGREKLQREREKIERDRVEMLKLERSLQKLERERLELEHRELKKQKRRIEEARIAAKRSALVRRDPYMPGHDDRKRPSLERIEAPSPPRFDQVSSSVVGPIHGRSAAGNYGDSGEMTSKKRDYGGKRDEIRKGDIRSEASGDFKRGSDFDLAPIHSDGGGHMMRISNPVKYPGQNYDDRGRDNYELGSRQDSSGGPLQASRSKNSSRYTDRLGDRPSDRSSGMLYRGGTDRDNGRRPMKSTDQRSASGNKLGVRDSSRERRNGDGDSGRYSDRPNSSWYGGGVNSGPINSTQNMVPNNSWTNDPRLKQSQNQLSGWRQADNPSSNNRYEERYVTLYKQGHPVSGMTNKGGNNFSKDYVDKPMRQMPSYQKSSYY